MADILKLVEELLALEKRIEALGGSSVTEIKKVKNAKIRKKLQKAYRRRDRNAMRDLWFNRD